MSEAYTIQTLLARRRITRAIGAVISEALREHIATLAPLFRQKPVFGEYIQSTSRESVKHAEQSFRELQSAYEKVATARPWLLPKELKSPIVQMNSTLELLPVEYTHEATAGGQSRSVAVTRPFKWLLTYGGYPP